MQVKINVVRSGANTDPPTCADQKQPMMKQLPNPTSKLILSPLFADIAQTMPPLVTSPIKSSQSTANGQIMTDLQSRSLLTPIAVLSQVSNDASPADNYYFAMSGPKTTTAKDQGIQQQPGSEVTSLASDTLKSSQMLPCLTALASRPDDDFSQLADRQVSNSSTNSLKQVKEQAAATVTMIGNGGRKVRGVVAASNKAMTTATANTNSNHQSKHISAAITTSTEQQFTEQAFAFTQQQQKIGSLQAFVSMANTVNQKVTNRKIVSQDIRNHTQPLFFEKEEAIALQPQQIGKKRAMRTNATARLAHITSLTTPQIRENKLQVANDSEANKADMNFYTDKAAISPLGFPVNEEDVPRSSEDKNDGINDMTVGNNQRQKGEVLQLNQDLIFDTTDNSSSFFEKENSTTVLKNHPMGAQKRSSTSKTRNVTHELALQFRVTATQDENNQQQPPHPSGNNKICVKTEEQEQNYTNCNQQQASVAKPHRAVLGQDYNLTNLTTTATANFNSATQGQRLPEVVSQSQLGGAKTTKAASGFQTQQQPAHFQRRYTKGLKKQALNHYQYPMTTTQSSSDYKILSTGGVGSNGNKENTDTVAVPQFKRNLLGISGGAIQQSSHSSLSSVGSMIINSQQQQQKQQPSSRHASPPLITSLLTRQQLKGVCVAPKTTQERKLSQIHKNNRKEHHGSQNSQNSSTREYLNNENKRPMSPPIHPVLQITGFSDNTSQKEDSESCSIADFIESTINSQQQECENNDQSIMNFRPITANHQNQKDKKLNVFQYLLVKEDYQQEDEKIDLPQSPPTRSRSVVMVEDLDSSTLEGDDQNRQEEMIKIQYPDTANCSQLGAPPQISALSDPLSNSKDAANKLYLHTVAKRGAKEEEEENKKAIGGGIASQLLLEEGEVVTERFEQTHQKDLLTTTSRNSITMRESLDFAYSESGMHISSQQKSHNGITAGQEGTINQTPSSIDFILTTKEEQSAATPQSYGGPTINSTQKQLDALHSLASIQAYMQKQVSDFQQKQNCCESQRRKKQLPVPAGDLSPSDQFLNQDLYDMTQKEVAAVVPDDKFSQYLDREIDRQELRLCTPKHKQKSRKKLNRTTLKLGGNGPSVTTSLVFDDEDIQLRDPVVAESKSPPLKTSTTVKQASENAKEPACNEEDDDDAYGNIASLALKRRETISLYATASPAARRDRSISRNSSRSNISHVTSFSGNENSTPSDIMLDNPLGQSSGANSPQIDSPAQSYFNTQPEQQNSSSLLLSPKDRLSFKIKLLRMGDNEDETKDVTTDQSSNSKSQAIATPPYSSHFKFNKSIDSSKSSSKLTENASGGNYSASPSPLWQKKSTSPNKNTLPKIFVPRSSQEGIQGIREQEMITKDKFSRCSNFLKQKQPIAPFQGSPDSKMVAISPSKQMLEAQSNKKMNPFTSSNSGKQTFINTKPMFLGPPALATRRRPSFQTNQSNSVANCQQNDIINGSNNEYATTTQPQKRRHERLESLEMREAIYESHGIMSSDEKQKTQSALFGGISGGQRQNRKAHSFGYESASRTGEKLTLPKKTTDAVEEIEMLSPPLTVRNSTLNKREEQVMTDLKHEKACQKLQSVQRLNQLKTTKKEKEKSKGHSLLTLKREEIVRVNSTRDLGNVSPKFVQITKVKVHNHQRTKQQLPACQ